MRTDFAAVGHRKALRLFVIKVKHKLLSNPPKLVGMMSRNSIIPAHTPAIQWELVSSSSAETVPV